MHTGSRNKLHLKKIEQFAEWAISKGYKRENIKGFYEVLRLRKDNESPLIYWQHHHGDHATTDRKSEPLVNKWFKDRSHYEQNQTLNITRA